MHHCDPYTSMQIRKATASDAQAVFDLRSISIRSLCKGFYPDDLLMQWTDGTHPSAGFTEFVSQVVYVVETNGTIVACGAIDKPTSQIDAVFVDPQYKNNGIGRKVMQFLEEIAMEHRVKSPLRLEATLNAAPFYRKLGFYGEALSQYHSPRGFTLDCIKMEKALSGHVNNG